MGKCIRILLVVVTLPFWGFVAIIAVICAVVMTILDKGPWGFIRG